MIPRPNRAPFSFFLSTTTTILFLLASTIPSIFAQDLTGAISDLPKCALPCFVSVIANTTTCSITDFYCQCTSGREAITTNVIGCLCDTTCNSDDLFAIQQGTLKICREALSSSSETYIAPTITSIQCQGLSATQTGTTTTTAVSGAGNQVTSGSTGIAAPFPTVAPMLAGACIGMVGLVAACGL